MRPIFLLCLFSAFAVHVPVANANGSAIFIHPDGMGALKKTALNPLANPEADGQPRFIWLPQMQERL